VTGAGWVMQESPQKDASTKGGLMLDPKTKLF
jgi:hypothetical protein